MAKKFSYLVSYDISEPKTLRKAAAYLERRGVRLQKSVFLLQLPQHQIKQAKADLEAIVGNEHHLMLIPLCSRCFEQSTVLGKQPERCVVF